MKIRFLLWPILALAVSIGITASAQTTATANAAGVLQVQIDVPPTWKPFLDDDIADALGRVLQDSFRRRGYRGEIVHLVYPQAPDPRLPLLRVNLTEWRISRTGHAECTMTTSLVNQGRETDLGLITHSEVTWIRERNRFGLARQHETAEAFEDAAEGAMRTLYRRIAESGQVPGFTVPNR